MSQSLFYWKLFCNNLIYQAQKLTKCVTILVLLEAVLQWKMHKPKPFSCVVTILVLLEAVLQSNLSLLVVL